MIIDESVLTYLIYHKFEPLMFRIRCMKTAGVERGGGGVSRAEFFYLEPAGSLCRQRALPPHVAARWKKCNCLSLIKMDVRVIATMAHLLLSSNRMNPQAHSVYRPDIDGLRAIAVLAVMAFHVNSRLMPGGFVGVDIFFVISGFLISGLIFKKLEQGSFTFSDFYTRRIKRLLPAYIVVALFTLAVSSYLLIPNDYIFYTSSLSASWGFASNIFFSLLSWGYFGHRTEEFPLLHTWSLSVEEQFYFIFPILLIFLFRNFRQRIVPILLVAGIIFLAISEMRTGKVGTYFLLPYRAHELILGVLTFFAMRMAPIESRGLATGLAIAGMALVLGSLALINRQLPFPGLNSMFPCLGTALLIYSCERENAINKVLSNRVLVFIGLISYSLYLWHWPILSFLRYRRIELTFWVATAAVALSFVLAYLTWKYVELPIRINKRITFKMAFLRYYAAPAAFFIAVGVYSYFTEGAPQRFSDDMRQLVSSYSFERDLGRACSIRADEYKSVSLEYLVDHCAFGNLKSPRADVLLFGDSHANHFKPFVEFLSKDAKLKSVYHVAGSCTAIDLFENEVGKETQPTVCQRHNADLLEMAGNFRFIVLASFWSYKGQEALFEARLGRITQKIIEAGAVPVLFKDNPNHETDISQCVLHKKRGWFDADKNCSIPYSYVADAQGSMDQVIDAVKRKYPRAVVIDPKIVMCTDSECATSIENTALYKDGNHINSKAATLLAERYLAARGNPFDIAPRAAENYRALTTELDGKHTPPASGSN